MKYLFALIFMAMWLTGCFLTAKPARSDDSNPYKWKVSGVFVGPNRYENSEAICYTYAESLSCKWKDQK